MNVISAFSGFICGLFGLFALWTGFAAIIRKLPPFGELPNPKNGIIVILIFALTVGSTVVLYKGAKVMGADLLGSDQYSDGEDLYRPDR